jgi:hypothetical protein
MRTYPIQGARSVKGKEKPPIPKYHYKLVTVSGSLEAGRMETALRERLEGSGLAFFAICHQTGGCDVMGDSGRNPLEGAALRNARAVAAELKKA